MNLAVRSIRNTNYNYGSKPNFRGNVADKTDNTKKKKIIMVAGAIGLTATIVAFIIAGFKGKGILKFLGQSKSERAIKKLAKKAGKGVENLGNSVGEATGKIESGAKKLGQNIEDGINTAKDKVERVKDTGGVRIRKAVENIEDRGDNALEIFLEDGVPTV